MTELRKIRRAVRGTRRIIKYQVKIIMESQEVPVVNLQHEVNLEEVVREVFKGIMEDRDLEIEILEDPEIPKDQPAEQGSVRTYPV